MKKNITQFLPLHLQRGNKAETQAEKYLLERGFLPVQRNYHCRAGEIDLIMQCDNLLVFIEVRYRSNPFYGSAAESITAEKIQRCRKTASHFLQSNQQYRHLYNRFDVIAISALKAKQEILWIKDAF